MLLLAMLGVKLLGLDHGKVGRRISYVGVVSGYVILRRPDDCVFPGVAGVIVDVDIGG